MEKLVFDVLNIDGQYRQPELFIDPNNNVDIIEIKEIKTLNKPTIKIVGFASKDLLSQSLKHTPSL